MPSDGEANRRARRATRRAGRAVDHATQPARAGRSEDVVRQPALAESRRDAQVIVVFRAGTARVGGDDAGWKMGKG